MPTAFRRLTLAVLVTFPIGVVADSQVPALKVSGGHLTLDGETVVRDVSITQSRFGFLFFYVPDRGLFTISAQPFEDSEGNGAFAGDRLAIELSGQRLVLQAEGDILSHSRAEAWGRFDPGYHLEIEDPMIGYGDSPEPPKAWYEQFSDRD